jgi:hypothetical protein
MVRKVFQVGTKGLENTQKMKNWKYMVGLYLVEQNGTSADKAGVNLAFLSFVSLSGNNGKS